MSGDGLVAVRLEALAAQALNTLSRRPLPTVMHLVDALASEVLPALLARETATGTSTPYLELSQAAEALTIVALRPALARGAAGDLRLARRQIQKLQELAVRVARLESRQGPALEFEKAEAAARRALYFVAAPDRPATEAHVLRHHPRPPKVWSPTQPSSEPTEPVPARKTSPRLSRTTWCREGESNPHPLAGSGF